MLVHWFITSTRSLITITVISSLKPMRKSCSMCLLLRQELYALVMAIVMQYSVCVCVCLSL